MPMLMTDVAKGAQAAEDIQKSTLMTAYNPVHVDEMIKQAPLETQKLQQSLQINEAALKKTQLDSAILLQNTMEDQKAKQTVQQLLKDPAIVDLPAWEQQKAIGNALTGSGMLKAGRDFLDVSQRTELHEQTAKTNQLKLDADKAEDIRRILSNMADDGSDVEQAFLELSVKAHADPKEMEMIRGTITGAERAGLPFKDIKTKLVAGAGSHAGDVARAKAAHDAAVLAEKEQYDRNKEAEDKRRHEQTMAAIRERGGRSEEAQLLREEIAKDQRVARLKAPITADIAKLGARETGLMRIAETKERDFTNYVVNELGGVIPEDPATMKIMGYSTASAKDIAKYEGYITRKNAVDAANKDTDPAIPTSEVSKIRKRIETQQGKIDALETGNPLPLDAPEPKEEPKPVAKGTALAPVAGFKPSPAQRIDIENALKAIKRNPEAANAIVEKLNKGGIKMELR